MVFDFLMKNNKKKSLSVSVFILLKKMAAIFNGYTDKNQPEAD